MSGNQISVQQVRKREAKTNTQAVKPGAGEEDKESGSKTNGET